VTLSIYEINVITKQLHSIEKGIIIYVFMWTVYHVKSTLICPAL
jgi:hypothetical protein